MTKRRLTPEEAGAWSRLASFIKPMGPPVEDFEALVAELDEVNPAPPPVKSQPFTRLVPPKPAARGVAAPANRKNERRVKRGKLELAARFDLHGHTQASAARALPAFLSNQQSDGARCVLVITGKGRMGEGILRRNFLDWLSGPGARRLVSGYAEAHPRHGGSGAFYVFLRKSETA